MTALPTDEEFAKLVDQKVDRPVITEYERYSQGTGDENGDSTVILCEGIPMTFDEIEETLNKMTDALAFYADPETYFAIGIFPDPPCGDFILDGSEVGDHGWKPGDTARRALGLDILMREEKGEDR